MILLEKEDEITAIIIPDNKYRLLSVYSFFFFFSFKKPMMILSENFLMLEKSYNIP